MSKVSLHKILSVTGLFIATFALMPDLSSCAHAGQWNFTVPAQQIQLKNGVFTLPLSQLQDGKARHFELTVSPTEKIRFFVVKSSDGVIRAAFDACEVCWKAKKGYVQQGNFMVCINCGLKFKTDKVNEITGGCNPVTLNKTIQGDNIWISNQDILSGSRYFQ